MPLLHIRKFLSLDLYARVPVFADFVSRPAECHRTVPPYWRRNSGFRRPSSDSEANARRNPLSAVMSALDPGSFLPEPLIQQHLTLDRRGHETHYVTDRFNYGALAVSSLAPQDRHHMLDGQPGHFVSKQSADISRQCVVALLCLLQKTLPDGCRGLTVVVFYRRRFGDQVCRFPGPDLAGLEIDPVFTSEDPRVRIELGAVYDDCVGGIGVRTPGTYAASPHPAAT